MSVLPPLKGKKASPLQVMKVHGDVNSRVDIYTATALGRGRVANPTSGLEDQSGHGVKKNLHSSDTQDRTRAAQPLVKRLAA